MYSLYVAELMFCKLICDRLKETSAFEERCLLAHLLPSGYFIVAYISSLLSLNHPWKEILLLGRDLYF